MKESEREGERGFILKAPQIVPNFSIKHLVVAQGISLTRRIFFYILRVIRVVDNRNLCVQIR